MELLTNSTNKLKNYHLFKTEAKERLTEKVEISNRM